MKGKHKNLTRPQNFNEKIVEVLESRARHRKEKNEKAKYKNLSKNDKIKQSHSNLKAAILYGLLVISYLAFSVLRDESFNPLFFISGGVGLILLVIYGRRYYGAKMQ